jgi:hypothetical protein
MPQTIRPLSPISASIEIRTFTFDFSSQMQPQDALISVEQISCEVDQDASEANDPTPDQRLIGAFRIGLSPASQIDKQAVYQQIGHCIGNVFYIIQCIALTTSGDQLSLWGRLPCIIPD